MPDSALSLALTTEDLRIQGIRILRSTAKTLCDGFFGGFPSREAA